MATNRYAGIAAARHLSDLPREAEKDAGPGPRTEAPAKPPRERRGLQPKEDKAYRKKRMVALILTTLVCLTVPALITLLVLFG